jgi:PilZ domain
MPDNTANPQDKPAVNRRLSKRKSARKSALVEVRKGALGLAANVAVQLLDISERGVRVIVKSPFQEHDEVEITLDGQGLKKAIKRIAVVCWSFKLESGEYATGFHFEKPLSYREVTNFARP